MSVKRTFAVADVGTDCEAVRTERLSAWALLLALSCASRRLVVWVARIHRAVCLTKPLTKVSTNTPYLQTQRGLGPPRRTHLLPIVVQLVQRRDKHVPAPRGVERVNRPLCRQPHGLERGTILSTPRSTRGFLNASTTQILRLSPLAGYAVQ